MMNGQYYSDDLVFKVEHARRIAEADAYRMVKQIEEHNRSAQPARRTAFHPFGWMRRLVLRIGGARA
jgi:hypothetical protein